MYLIRTILLLLLINLAFAYRLESQSDDLNTTSILKEEIAELRDNEDNYQPWREWPNRLFPRYHTVNDLNKPSWTIVTRSKTISPSESTPLTTPVVSITPTDSSSEFQLSSRPGLISPTLSDHTGETSSTYLPSVSEAKTSIHSPTIESSFNSDHHLQTSTSSLLTSLIPSFTNFDTTFPNLISSTPSVPFSSLSSVSEDPSSNQISSDGSIDRTDYDAISSTSTIHPTIGLPDSTVHYDSTDEPILTTHSPNDNQQHLHQTVISLPPEAMKNLSIEYENSLRKVFELAYFRLHNKNATDLNVQLNNWKKNGTRLLLVYSVQVDKRYLNNDEIKSLLSKISDREMADMLNANSIISKAEPFVLNLTEPPISPQTTTERPEFKLSELVVKKIFNIDEPYFWIFIGLVFIIMLICCFYLGMLVCWWKHRTQKSKFNDSTFKDQKDVNQFSPAGSDYSSDTLNTENFIRWRSKPGSKQKLNKRAKSLFKDDFKSSSLGKLARRKEIGSSPSNEFEYISFSSDTTNSSLQRDGSINKKSSIIRHHPYSSPDHNKNLSLNHNRNLMNRNSSRELRNVEKDYQQDYQQDYHIPTIERTTNHQLNQPNGIKLLISRGIQNNLLTTNEYNTSAVQQSPTKKFPLEIPNFNNYYGNNVSVLNLSKEKLIPLNQYTSDSSSTTTSISKDERSKFSPHEQVNQTFTADSKFEEPRLESRTQSRSESRGMEPRRLIKKEIIEEFETVTTTTTFKNKNRNSPNFGSNGEIEAKIKDAQLNEQTKSIISAIRDELKRFNQQPVHVQQFKKLEH